MPQILVTPDTLVSEQNPPKLDLDKKETASEAAEDPDEQAFHTPVDNQARKHRNTTP